MTLGKQWIHFDAQFPIKFGHDILERFGPAGQLLFIQFLCACKRSFPQGQISYRTEDELRVLLGAHFDFVDRLGDKWGLNDFWKWCGMKRVTRSKTRGGRRYVFAAHWEAWEDAHNAAARQRNRRSRAKTDTRRYAQRGEVRGVRLEVGGVRGEGERGFAVETAPTDAAQKLQSQLEEVKDQQPDDRRNGTHDG